MRTQYKYSHISNFYNCIQCITCQTTFISSKLLCITKQKQTQSIIIQLYKAYTMRPTSDHHPRSNTCRVEEVIEKLPTEILQHWMTSSNFHKILVFCGIYSLTHSDVAKFLQQQKKTHYWRSLAGITSVGIVLEIQYTKIQPYNADVSPLIILRIVTTVSLHTTMF